MLGAMAFLVGTLVVLAIDVAAPAAMKGTGAAEPLRMTVGTLGTIGSLDPRAGNSIVAREVWNIQYPTLTALDPATLDPTAGVAIAWTPLPNGRGWRYELRPGLTWSDGKPVTATDVVYSLDHARDEHWPYAGSMLDGLTARALDAHTVAVTSSSTNRVLPGLRLHVVPAHVYAKVSNVDNDTTALGVADGPWHVVSKSASSVELGVLGRPGGPPLDQIIFRTYPTAGALIDALSRGDVDVISGVPTTDLDRLHALDGVTVDPVGGTVQAFRSDHVTGFLPEPERPSLVVFGPTVAQYAGIVAATRPPGERLSNVAYAIGAVVLLVLFVAAYWIVARLRRRFVT
jgi:peptide/nickel transport system substrate-binding protein